LRVILSSLEEGAEAVRGLAVIVDVFRAFTCAALMLDMGVEEIILVESPEEAFQLKNKDPELLLVGEVQGQPIEGFDLPNSPYEILKKGPETLRGRKVVHRSSSGVQGALLAVERAESVLLASFLNAAATARFIACGNYPLVHIVAMGHQMKSPTPEDEWCARYLASLLEPSGERNRYDHWKAMREILASYEAQKFLRSERSYYPPEDALISLQRDVVDVVMVARKEGGLALVRAERCGSS
jgi:2-phosphosulfolactate phosphatase